MSSPARGWTGFAERGSMAGIRLGALLCRLIGRRGWQILLLNPVSFYFFLTAGSVRRASRQYLDTLWAHSSGPKALGSPPSWRNVARHIKAFGQNLIDRFIAWSGDLESIHFEHCGSEHLFRLAREGRGGILLGSHLGSFDMMRMLAGHHELVINVLMYTRHAERISSFFSRLDPESRIRVINIDPGSMRTAFEVRACLERGEFVGILGDRVPPGSANAGEAIDFLGRPARFPLSPYELALVLGAPLLFAICVRHGDATYRAVVEPLYEGPPLSRRERPARARELARSYVSRLEDFCAEAPYQWFNFYDYWDDAKGAER